ncbi:hypothetical protein D3C71_1315310 [compost metagenome]
MFPKVIAEPARARIGNSPGSRLSGFSIAPYIGDHMGYPARCVIIRFRGFCPRSHKAFHKPHQGLIELAQIGRTEVPMVHLHIDIQVVVPIPGRLNLICP